MEQVTKLLKNIEDLQHELEKKEKIIFNKDIELDVKENDIRTFQSLNEENGAHCIMYSRKKK